MKQDIGKPADQESLDLGVSVGQNQAEADIGLLKFPADKYAVVTIAACTRNCARPTCRFTLGGGNEA